jgi:hypothetical protein
MGRAVPSQEGAQSPVFITGAAVTKGGIVQDGPVNVAASSAHDIAATPTAKPPLGLTQQQASRCKPPGESVAPTSLLPSHAILALASSSELPAEHTCMHSEYRLHALARCCQAMPDGGCTTDCNAHALQVPLQAEELHHQHGYNEVKPKQTPEWKKILWRYADWVSLVIVSRRCSGHSGACCSSS